MSCNPVGCNVAKNYVSTAGEVAPGGASWCDFGRQIFSTNRELWETLLEGAGDSEHPI
jgi:hypothetical protein